MGTPLRALLETSTASIRSWAPPCPQPPRAQPSLRFHLAQLPPARSGCCHQRVARLVPGVPGWGTAPGGLVQGERCWAQPWGSSAGHQGQVWRMPEALAPSPGGTKKGPCWGRWHGEGGRGWLWPPGQPLPQLCPGAAAGRCCTKRVLGAAPCGLPLLTAAPARAAPGTFPPSTQNLHWKKKIQPPKLSFSQLLVQRFAASELAGPARRRRPLGQHGSGAEHPEPILVLPEHRTSLQRMYRNTKVFIIIFFFINKEIQKALQNALQKILTGEAGGGRYLRGYVHVSQGK